MTTPPHTFRHQSCSPSKPSTRRNSLFIISDLAEYIRHSRFRQHKVKRRHCQYLYRRCSYRFPMQPSNSSQLIPLSRRPCRAHFRDTAAPQSSSSIGSASVETESYNNASPPNNSVPYIVPASFSLMKTAILPTDRLTSHGAHASTDTQLRRPRKDHI